VAPLAYFGSVALLTLGCLSAMRAKSIRFKASCLEEGINNPLPFEEGKTAYVGLRALCSAQQVTFFPNQKNVLFGRLHIIHSTSEIDHTLDALSGEIPQLIYPFTLIHQAVAPINGPKKLILTHAKTKIIAHNLDLAEWIGTTKGAIHLIPDHPFAGLQWADVKTEFIPSAYTLKAEWFEGNELTLFAEAIKKGTEVHLHKPSDYYPFIATTQEPAQLLGALKVKAHQSSRDAKLYTIAAASLGLGAFAWQKRNAINWKHLATDPQLRKIYSCMGFSLITWCAYENQSIIRRIPRKAS
jgi:hypothetical protein